MLVGDDNGKQRTRGLSSPERCLSLKSVCRLCVGVSSSSHTEHHLGAPFASDDTKKHCLACLPPTITAAGSRRHIERQTSSAGANASESAAIAPSFIHRLCRTNGNVQHSALPAPAPALVDTVCRRRRPGLHYRANAWSSSEDSVKI